jgi:hypothetical protein
MYESDGHLVGNRYSLDDELIVADVLAWMSLEQTPGGASEMEYFIEELHNIAPETTKRAIAYVASLGLEGLGKSLYTPWSVAVSVLVKYGVSIRGATMRLAVPQPN